MGLNIFGTNIPENMDSLNVFGVEIDELIVFGTVVWKKQKYYFIAFLPNGGSGSMAQQTMPVGVATALASNAFSRTGYRFNGWGKTASQVSPNYQNGAAVTDIAAAGQTLNLYAIWLANVYYVDYNGNTATGGGTARSTHTYGVYKTLTPNGYSKTGYLFNGWTAPGGTVYSNQHNVINLTATHGAVVTMSARWSPITYYIDYYGNTATGGSTARSIHTYDVYKTLTPNGFWKTGYLFNGWTANGGANVFNNQHNVINLTTTNGVAVALYARWSPITYYVAYNGNGADGGGTGTSTHTYDVAQALTPNGFTRSYCQYLGWSVDGGSTVHYGNSQSVANLTTAHGGTVNLFAVWKPFTVINYSDRCTALSGNIHGVFSYWDNWDSYWENANRVGCGYITDWSGGYMWMCTNNAIDLTNVSRVRVRVGGHAGQYNFGVGTVHDGTSAIRSIREDNFSYNGDTTKEFSLDVSDLKGNYYIKMWFYSGENNGYATHFWWEECVCE